MLDEKRLDKRMGFKTFDGKDGNRYLVFHTLDGSYHGFVEVEAKQARRVCGTEEESNTRIIWEKVYSKNDE